MFSGSSQAGVHSLDLTPVNSGGMEARVALHPAAETVLVTVRPSVSVELPCDGRCFQQGTKLALFEIFLNYTIFAIKSIRSYSGRSKINSAVGIEYC